MKQLEYINKCPLCDDAHRYILSIYYKDEDEIALFGAGQKPKPQMHSGNKWSVTFYCPVSNEYIVNDILLNDVPVEGVIRVESKISDLNLESEINEKNTALSPKIEVQNPTLHSSTDILMKDLEEWVKSSMQTARDFCKTMITVSTGAIPIFYTVWSALGNEKSDYFSLSWTTLIPSIGFLSATVLYIIAHQPQYYNLEGVNLIEFRIFRKARLKHLNKYMKIATFMFVISVFISILLFSIKIYSL